MNSFVVDSPVKAIPSSDAIRERLSQIAREREVLRGLLKLAKKKEHAELKQDVHPLERSSLHLR